MPVSQQKPKRRRGAPSALRGVTDELGITTPEEAKRPRRKGPLRVKILDGRRKYYRD